MKAKLLTNGGYAGLENNIGDVVEVDNINPSASNGWERDVLNLKVVCFGKQEVYCFFEGTEAVFVGECDE